jgi:hypothetical protein
MVNEIETDLKQPQDGLAQYLTIPKELVWDSRYPFERKKALQRVIIKIDEVKKVIIISPISEV